MNANVPDVVIYMPVVTAALAAIAALSSWATVLQNRRNWRATVEPWLTVQPNYVAQQNTFFVDLDNVGGGVARRIHIKCVAQNLHAEGFVAPMLRPGEGCRVLLKKPVRAPIERGQHWVMVGCADATEAFHFWTHAAKHDVIRARWWESERRRVDSDEEFAKYFPDVDVTTRTEVGVKTAELRRDRARL